MKETSTVYIIAIADWLGTITDTVDNTLFSFLDPKSSPRALILKVVVATLPLLIFSELVLSLSKVQPSPLEPMGYFSIENITPAAFWIMLVALATVSVFSIESNYPSALPAIILTMLAMRLPLLVMSNLPPEPDSYVYMGIIQKWHQTGAIDLSLDLRSRYWPVFFVFLYGLRQLGINELIIWSWGTMALYIVNAVLIFLFLLRFLGRRAAMYALLIVSLTPTFNFYYSQVMSPQLLASTIFLTALLALFSFERRHTKVAFAVFIGLFGLLVLTHHLTTLLLIGYVFLLLFERPLAWLLERLGIGSVDRPNSISRRNLTIMGTGMLVVSIGYLLFAAGKFSRLTLSTLRAVVAGETSVYNYGSYSISSYAFNTSSLFVYGFRLLPLAISMFVALMLWSQGMLKVIHSAHLSAKKLRSLTGTFAFGALIVVSLVVLKGLFLEIPRLLDLTVLFSSVISTSFFLQKRLKSTVLLKVALLLSLMMVSSTVGIAVHNAEFVYYPQEKQAALYAAGKYPGVTLYTDERLLPFVAFFAPNLVVDVFPSTLSAMLPNRTSRGSLVLLSYHSLTYDRYRHLFGQSPSDVLQFVQSNGRMVYYSEGVSLYYLE